MYSQDKSKYLKQAVKQASVRQSSFQIKNILAPFWTNKPPNGRFLLPTTQSLTWALFPETLSGSVITQ